MTPCFQRVYVQNALRVLIQNVPVCTGTTRTCLCARGAGTHGDVLNQHTEALLKPNAVFSTFFQPQHTNTNKHTKHTHTHTNCVRGEGVQVVLTLICGGEAQTCHDDRVVELKEQLGVEEVDGEGQEGKVKEEGRGRVKENAPWMTWR